MTMPILTEEFLKEKLDWVMAPMQMQLRSDDFDRFMMYNGATREIIERAIKKEFKKPETIEELIARLIPLNFPQKIINKLANVFNEGVIRTPVDENEIDQELIEAYEKSMEINSRQKEANRYFKLFKANLAELAVDDKGCPKLRNLPRHTYEVFSHSVVCPNVPDLYMKFLNFEKDPELQRFVWWTDDQHAITDGKGKFMHAEMLKMNNPDLINPFGVAPFIYINSSTYQVRPIPDADLLRMGIVIPLLLSDLAFATKYLSWSVVYSVGAGGDIPFSPNSVIDLDFGPNGETPIINTVKPNVAITDTLELIEHLTMNLLSTKNLSSSGTGGKMDASNAASGVAKALDSAESQEDKKDQQAYFLKAEKEMWLKLKDHMIPAWRKMKLLSQECSSEFSKAFQPSIVFQEPKVIISEREQIEVSTLRIKAGLTTVRREIQKLNPDMDEGEIDLLIEEIRIEGINRNATMLNDVVREDEDENAQNI